jgi:hypothetical protein
MALGCLALVRGRDTGSLQGEDIKDIELEFVAIVFIRCGHAIHYKT